MGDSWSPTPESPTEGVQWSLGIHIKFLDDIGAAGSASTLGGTRTGQFLWGEELAS